MWRVVHYNTSTLRPLMIKPEVVIGGATITVRDKRLRSGEVL